jgi:hypothetical protein
VKRLRYNVKAQRLRYNVKALGGITMWRGVGFRTDLMVSGEAGEGMGGGCEFVNAKGDPFLFHAAASPLLSPCMSGSHTFLLANRSIDL